MGKLIGAPSEIHDGEQRVAVTPDSAKELMKLGYEVAVQSGAGLAANFSDKAYEEAGVEIIKTQRQLWKKADIIVKVRAPEQIEGSRSHEAGLLEADKTLVSFVWPGQNEDLMKRLAKRKANVIAMDSVPRISRAQKMDALSSMANIGGYRAVIEAANQFGRFFTGQITAAGKVPPAKVMIIGAGVAGLAAIGAANSLGAIVRAFDTRPEVKQQVESMGAEFLELDFEEEGSGSGGYAKVMSKEFIEAEMALFAEQAKEVDIIITTALIPGKPAPKLITAEMVESMRDGSVIVDMAAEQGGNCELTVPGELAERHGVKIIGYTDLPSRLPTQASQLYATNIRHLLDDLTPEKDGEPNINMEDDVIRGATVIKEGKITWPPPPLEVSAAPPPAKETSAPPVPTPEEARKSGIWDFGLLAVGAIALYALGSVAPPDFLQHLTVFVLACFVGYRLIWNVSPALHTPLMSVTNAISGIIVVGAMLQLGSPSWLVTVLAAFSVLIATINIAGGFYVTQRMLKMFQKS
ncbi:MAG: Re/Si-specific NAD(P)(+) transhydrogenase subunit alpha [Hyphomicrobiales bacterium]